MGLFGFEDPINPYVLAAQQEAQRRAQLAQAVSGEASGPMDEGFSQAGGALGAKAKDWLFGGGGVEGASELLPGGSGLAGAELLPGGSSMASGELLPGGLGNFWGASSTTSAAPSSAASAGLAPYAAAAAPLALALLGNYMVDANDKPNRQYKPDEILAGLRADESGANGKVPTYLQNQIKGWSGFDDNKRRGILDKASGLGMLNLPGFADTAGNTIKRQPENLNFDWAALKGANNFQKMNSANRQNFGLSHWGIAERGMTPTEQEVSGSRLDDATKQKYLDLIGALNG